MDTLFSLIYFTVIFLATPALLTIRHAVVACVRGHITVSVIVLCVYVVVHAFFIINDGSLSETSIDNFMLFSALPAVQVLA